MARGSERKRSNRRSNSNSKSQQNLTANPPASSFRLNYRFVVLIASFAFICCIVVLFTNSPSTHDVFEANSEASNVYSIEVVNEFPHDPEAFTQVVESMFDQSTFGTRSHARVKGQGIRAWTHLTQSLFDPEGPLMGLVYAEKDILFESTGLEGHSSVRKVSLKSGKVLSLFRMNDSYFGEGLTLIRDRLFQVTWLQKAGFIYDRNNFSRFEKFSHEMQDGWGLATDGKFLFGSDGTSTLYKIDPHTFKAIGKHIVKYKGHEVFFLNELEFVNGQVWANVWQSDCIARISPEDGTVLGWILLHSLREGSLASWNGRMDVLNGIAWDKHQNRLFVTGKWWPKLFEIKVHPMKTPLKMDIEQICIPPRYAWQ